MVLQFGLLRGAARRALFRQFTFGRFTAGMSAEAIITDAKALGLSIRRQDALSIVREVSGRQAVGQRMRFVADINIPSMSHYTPTRLRLEKRFQTIFEVRGRNVLTGEPASRRVSFISDERVSLAEMKRELLERAQQEYAPREGIDYTTIAAVEGLQRAEPPFTEED